MSKKKIVTIVALFSIVILTLLGFPMYTTHVSNEFEVYLVSEGFEVRHGIVDSPSLIIPVKLDEFLQKARDLDAVVWRHNVVWRHKVDGFYIFEPDMTIAYRYLVE